MIVKTHEPLAPFTYIKIGGPAEKLVVATTTTQLAEAVSLALLQKIPYLVLGAASNVLVSDEGLPGLVIINRAQTITPDANHPHRLHVDSGTIINQLVNFANGKGLAGLEEFLGLPGTLGGAIFNNSHHLSHLIGEVVYSVTVLDQKGNVKKYTHDQCRFAYDYSIFQDTKEPILSAELNLRAGDPEKLSAKAKAALKHRRDTQPLEFPSSGCMFKNPSGSAFSAGYLVDKSGCKGKQVGQAMVSVKHANFMVNLGGAKAADYVTLSNQVRRRVHEVFGIWLNREIFFLGSHPGLET